jgi:hypothetical protein
MPYYTNVRLVVTYSQIDSQKKSPNLFRQGDFMIFSGIILSLPTSHRLEG